MRANPNPPRTAKRQRGATIVEMMVAITIGLLVTVVVSQAYLTGTATQSGQSHLTRLQESGRFGMLMLINEISKAGFRNPLMPYPGKDFGPSNPAGNRLNLIEGVEGGPSDPSHSTYASDHIVLRFYGHDDPSAAGNVADGHVLDCFGNAITQDTLVTEVFSIVKDPDNGDEPALACAATYVAGTAGAPGCAAGSTCSTAAIPLIPGVESMQALYGIDSNGDGVVDYYDNSAGVASWPNVLSVKVSVVVRSPAGNDNPSGTAVTWNHFGTTYAPGNAAPVGDDGSVYVSPADHRFRQIFTTVVTLRNYEY